MIRYQITVIRPDIGRRTVIVWGVSEGESIEKARRAYPGSVIITVDALSRKDRYCVESLAKATAKSNRLAKERHEENLQKFLDCIPPEGASVKYFSELFGVSSTSIRKWAVDLEGKGKVTRKVGSDRFVVVCKVGL